MRSDPKPAVRSQRSFIPFAKKMTDHGLPAPVIQNFRRHYDLLTEGHTGHLPSAALTEIRDLPTLDALPPSSAVAVRAIQKTAMIKLNGGLGTGMGMAKPKSLLPLRHGLTFLDLVAKQTLALRERFDCKLPLILMNSYHTRKDSLAALQQYGGLHGPIPLDFLQHKVPRIRADDLAPVICPTDPDAEWCPPGHGDIYMALWCSGLLQTLLDRGIEYAFISNCDNLGAILDLRILEWFAREQVPFLMEVAERTESDQKGGHLARLRNGKFTLREWAQCPPGEADDFRDIQRYRHFNTNNVWINLKAFDRLLRANDGCLPLPMMCNAKSLEPQNSSANIFYQLETALGAAISLFDDARVLTVARNRFIPVKTTNDLLRVWSDRYQLTNDFRLASASDRIGNDILVDLDPDWYRNIDQFTKRFPYGSPSLKNCTRLKVLGDVRFGKQIVMRGDLTITNAENAPRYLADGAVLQETNT